MRSNRQLSGGLKKWKIPKALRGARCPRCAAKRSPELSECKACQRPFVFPIGDARELLWEKLPISAGGDAHPFTVNQLYLCWQGAYSYRAQRPLLRALIFASIGITAPALLTQLCAHFSFQWGEVTPIFELFATLPLLALGALLPISTVARYSLRGRRRRQLCFFLSLLGGALLCSYAEPATLTSAAFVFLTLSLCPLRRSSASQERFMFELRRVQRHAPKLLTRLIQTPRLQHPLPDWPADRLYDYGIRQILIVDQDLTVDLLTRAGLHLEKRVLIFSLNGYPQYMHQLGQRLCALAPGVKISLLLSAGFPLKELHDRRKRLGLGRQSLQLIAWQRESLSALQKHLGFRPLQWEKPPIDTLSSPVLLHAISASLDGGQFSAALKKAPRPKLWIASL